MNESASQVYIVDDDPSVRQSLGRLIRSTGLKVRTFATAHDLLARLGEELPSCLLLDMQRRHQYGSFELERTISNRTHLAESLGSPP